MLLPLTCTPGILLHLLQSSTAGLKTWTFSVQQHLGVKTGPCIIVLSDVAPLACVCCGKLAQSYMLPTWCLCAAAAWC